MSIYINNLSRPPSASTPKSVHLLIKIVFLPLNLILRAVALAESSTTLGQSAIFDAARIQHFSIPAVSRYTELGMPAEYYSLEHLPFQSNAVLRQAVR